LFAQNQIVKACKFYLYSVNKVRHGNGMFPHKSKTKIEKELKKSLVFLDLGFFD
jgi:hypothetical protein